MTEKTQIMTLVSDFNYVSGDGYDNLTTIVWVGKYANDQITHAIKDFNAYMKASGEDCNYNENDFRGFISAESLKENPEVVITDCYCHLSSENDSHHEYCERVTYGTLYKKYLEFIENYPLALKGTLIKETYINKINELIDGLIEYIGDTNPVANAARIMEMQVSTKLIQKD